MSARKHKQQVELFCRAYVIDLNGAKAAITAGYAKGSAKVAASRLLTRDNVKARIAEMQKEIADRLEISAEKVLTELAKLGYANMFDYITIGQNGQADINFSALTREQAAAIQEIKVDTTGGTGDGERRQVLRTTFKLADKGANLERLGRHLKLFTDRVEHSGLEGLAERLNEIRKKKNGDIGA